MPQYLLEDIMLREISLSQKYKNCVIPLIGGLQSSQIHGDRKQNGDFQGLEKGEWGVSI